MDKQTELTTTTALVKDILTRYPMARNSDNYLYVRVVKILNPQAADRPFADVMLGLKELELPCYETVRRSRAKLQKEFPELKGTERIQKERKKNEEIYKEYALS